jgi:hypothetical protein
VKKWREPVLSEQTSCDFEDQSKLRISDREVGVIISVTTPVQATSDIEPSRVATAIEFESTAIAALQPLDILIVVRGFEKCRTSENTTQPLQSLVTIMGDELGKQSTVSTAAW